MNCISIDLWPVQGEPVIPWINKALDRLVINLAAGRLPGEPRFEAHGREAEALLARSDFFDWDGANVPELTFEPDGEFEFRSVFASPWESNNTVRGEVFRTAGGWLAKPSVILVHGYNSDPAYRSVMRKWSRRLTWRGLNGILMELPFHLRRRPKSRGGVRDFLSSDLLAVTQATKQSLLDLRSLVAWLKSHGAPQVGLWGNSLGGWLEGLLVSHSEAVDCAAFLTPVSRMDRALVEIDFAALVRRSVEETGFEVGRFNLENHRPRLDAKRLFFVAGRDDQFVPLETLNHLAELWGGVETHVLPHGHISILMSEDAADLIANWFWGVMGAG